MTVLVLGPNGSGKSAFAEKLAAKLSTGRLFYVATMIPFGEEGRARVEKHRSQRAGLGFKTVERPAEVAAVPIPPDAAVLLEDVPNLLSNAMFEHSCGEDEVFTDVVGLCGKCRDAVLVSIAGLTVSNEYDCGTNVYIAALDRLNGRLHGFADVVAIMDDKRPVFVKGDINALD